MVRRTIKITWLPSSAINWKIFTAARKEAARVWSWLIDRHKTVRQNTTKWPGRGELKRDAKGLFPNLNAQSVQQTIDDFCEAISSVEVLRKKGKPFRYPHQKTTFRQVIFTNQGAKHRDGRVVLPCGQAGRLTIPIPKNVILPGRLMEVRLNYGSVEIVCKLPDITCQQGPTIGVDLGVNTVIAATDGQKAVLISGREIKATIQLRNKRLAEISAKQSHKSKGSRRHKRLQRRKHKTLDNAKNKIRDLCHKATRKVADAFPNAKAYVGKPFNDACRSIGRKQAQTVSSACNRKLISMLAYKLAACIEIDEAYSSQTCPSCGQRSKHRRTHRCRCGLTAPRDLVGCANIRAIGITGQMQPGCDIPNVVRWVQPAKYPGQKPGSRADTTQVARRTTSARS